MTQHSHYVAQHTQAKQSQIKRAVCCVRLLCGEALFEKSVPFWGVGQRGARSYQAPSLLTLPASIKIKFTLAVLLWKKQAKRAICRKGGHVAIAGFYSLVSPRREGLPLQRGTPDKKRPVCCHTLPNFVQLHLCHLELTWAVHLHGEDRQHPLRHGHIGQRVPGGAPQRSHRWLRCGHAGLRQGKVVSDICFWSTAQGLQRCLRSASRVLAGEGN
eukprot:1158565-Pelagomonas_calceolata.AAC.10